MRRDLPVVFAFEQRASTPFYGLAWTHAGVWAGMEEFSVVRPDAYSVGFSSDEGRTFTRRMAICDVQAAHCAAHTDGHSRYPDVLLRFLVDELCRSLSDVEGVINGLDRTWAPILTPTEEALRGVI